ncbi:MAG: hypothetical protein ABSD03_14280 [Vulcanimicrobiaceae bacterium]
MADFTTQEALAGGLAAVRLGGDEPHAFIPGPLKGYLGNKVVPLCKVCRGRAPYMAHDERLIAYAVQGASS